MSGIVPKDTRQTQSNGFKPLLKRCGAVTAILNLPKRLSTNFHAFVSSVPPALVDSKARHCSGCFPRGRKRRDEKKYRVDPGDMAFFDDKGEPHE